MVTSENPPGEKIVDRELLKIFSDKENLLKVLAIFKLAKEENGKDKAKNKIKTYKNTPPQLTKILEKIAESPNDTMKTLKPVRDELDKKLMEYAPYAICVKPIWRATKRLGCMALRCFGLTVWSSGEVIHLLHQAVEESMQAAGHTPDSEVKELMDNISEVGNKAKKLGDKIDNVALSEIEKNRRVAKPNSSNAAASESTESYVTHGSSVQAKEPVHGGSKRVEEPVHGGSERVEEPVHGGSERVEEPVHGGSERVEEPVHGGSERFEEPVRGGSERVEEPVHGGSEQVEEPVHRNLELEGKPKRLPPALDQHDDAVDRTF